MSCLAFEASVHCLSQAVFERQRFADSHANSHRRPPVRVPRVWQGVHHQGKPQGARSHPRRSAGYCPGASVNPPRSSHRAVTAASVADDDRSTQGGSMPDVAAGLRLPSRSAGHITGFGGRASNMQPGMLTHCGATENAALENAMGSKTEWTTGKYVSGRVEDGQEHFTVGNAGVTTAKSQSALDLWNVCGSLTTTRASCVEPISLSRIFHFRYF